MPEPSCIADFNNPASLEAARVRYRLDLIDVGADVIALIDKASRPEGLTDLSEWEQALLGLCVCFTLLSIMLPEPLPPSLEPSRN